MKDHNFVPWRIRKAWRDIRRAADDVDRSGASRMVGPFEVTAEEVADLERRLNSEWKTVKFKLDRMRRYETLSYITVSPEEK